jgi:hypothetical protein
MFTQSRLRLLPVDPAADPCIRGRRGSESPIGSVEAASVGRDEHWANEVEQAVQTRQDNKVTGWQNVPRAKSYL